MGLITTGYDEFGASIQEWIDEPMPERDDSWQQEGGSFAGMDLGGFFDEPPPPAPAIDYQNTYTNPDPSARRVGTDSGGNPVWQLIDAGGDTIQWLIDKAGGAFGFANLGNRSVVGPPSPATALPAVTNPFAFLSPVPAGTMAPNTGVIATEGPNAPRSGQSANFGGSGDQLTDLISNILGGNNSTKSPAPSISVSPISAGNPLSFFNDSSVRSSSIVTSNVSNNLNSASLVDSVVSSIAKLFPSGNAPVAAARSVTPSNDSILGNASFPGAFSAGQSIDAARSEPGAKLPLGGSTTGSVNDYRGLMITGIVIAAIFGAIALFRK